ncbi:hypothetical protein [Sinorhizobium saheli]|uniref:Predicted pPIWI-associating nuclease domain-containing protein n=3 Tax=Sinorhizobium TaxID=28105 RepID=A0A178YSI3_SINSA|nr:hypothetical protein [Sinorhizobium saheli]MQW88653.1 hypothetical protein [Sinorhizobium saheli]OAP50347.1 hypothetical protein ATB98_09725 [Sinorhizobium saheli]PJR12756.1 hypothetical protein CEJ86_24500 [Sinorhizobium meliloti]
MTRRMTPQQYNAWVRRYNAEVDRVNRANRQAQEKYVREVNREIDRINRHNQQVVNDYNRAVRQHNQKNEAAVRKYNQAVNAHNAKVRQNRQALARQIASLKSQTSTTTRYVEVRNSAYDVYDSFERVERAAQYSSGVSDLLELTEKEASNSANVAEALTSEAPLTPEQMDDSGILEYLSGFSEDLCDRWKGALYALNPVNTDAARHFCTSVREIFTEILEKWADNADVIAADSNYDRTPNGTPSRRAKIRYLLKRKGADSPEMLGFVEKDIDDILQLFRVFNEATHGAAGKHGFAKLQSIRQRVEGGIMFLAAIAL